MSNRRPSPSLHHLFIINQAGGKVYQHDFLPSGNKIGSDACLLLMSTFHSMHAIAGADVSPHRPGILPGAADQSQNQSQSQSPAPPQGIVALQAKHFQLRCLQTLTGLKFVVTADPDFVGLERFLQLVYRLYADYVCKNPFYVMEMPIERSCSKFTEAVVRLAQGMESGKHR